MSERFGLTGRVGVVTGAARGIGAAVAATLAAEGMDLILNDHGDPDRLDLCAQEIRTAFGVAVQTHQGDIAEPATSAELSKRAFTSHRRLDVWVNNAGVLLDGLIGMIPPADIDRVVGVNLLGVLHGTQQAARLMTRGGGGSIVNVSSITGRFGNKGQLVYGAAKAGVIGATLSAAKELAPNNIRVNAVAPGLIETDMAAQLPAAGFAERMASIGMNRIGTPRDVADCVLFLASDLSRYVTGQVIGVDGAMVI
ncbi:SDR family NAD(P)-dependent oxidoreductase [Mycobacterium sp. shizuoka-1]|uniref:SDR family NAD(P)-dependent oxidoreductase n=1 Tax=Mycobacterium sp. shizuoka-1 TaxID=2039281 RepID=UPI000C05DAA4|nr:SDR family NAD(P)-dependent oxidoreductase [Mycobacterium sp. shizuoka-1]GAY17471.1 3-oxoacyl-ACP reductase [Mycobacterium sp. shizuoka-1]